MKSKKMNVLSYILSAKDQHKPLLALLVDPDKNDAYMAILPYINQADIILVGGSTGTNTETCINLLRLHVTSPIVLFPGNIQQFTPTADALLFLTLLNAQTPDILINPHVQVAQRVLNAAIETIPMGYILIDGERKSSVEIATNCQPIPQNDTNYIVSTAIAAQLLGKKLVYLEAGSGAKKPVSIDIIRTVKEKINIPLIVGGGICSPEEMIQAFDAGADIVVIGNHFEKFPEQLSHFMRVKQDKYGK